MKGATIQFYKNLREMTKLTLIKCMTDINVTYYRNIIKLKLVTIEILR